MFDELMITSSDPAIFLYTHHPWLCTPPKKLNSPPRKSQSTNLKVKSVGVDVDGLNSESLVVLGLQSSRVGVGQAKGVGEGGVGSVQDDGGVDVLCSR